TQALELGVPVVLALNMIDVAEAQGVTIDADRLSHQLGVRVVPMQANKGRGLDQLKEAIAASVAGGEANGKANGAAPSAPAFPEPFEQEVRTLRMSLASDIEPFLVRRLLLDVGGYIETKLENQDPKLNERIQEARRRLETAGCPVPAVEARTRYAWIR